MSIRGTWIDILALAGDSTYGDEGLIQVADGVGLTDEQIAAILCIKLNEWLEAKQRLIDTERIQVSKHNVIRILKWKRYQSEYERTKEAQERYREKKSIPQNYHSKLSPKTIKEKREERREKRYIKKERDKERNKHSLSKKDKDLILKNQKHYLETYGIPLKYIQTFFLQCEAKGYKYVDFGKALLVWWKKDHPNWKKPKKLKDPDLGCPICRGAGSVQKKEGKREVCECRRIK